MAGDAPARRMTVDEYLAFEERATEKHEFLDGQMYARSGGTAAHSELIVAVGGELRAALGGSPCRAYDSNLRVKSMVTGLYTYPDVSIACGGAQFEGDARTTMRVYGEGTQAELGSVGVRLAVDAVYEGVELEAVATPPG